MKQILDKNLVTGIYVELVGKSKSLRNLRKPSDRLGMFCDMTISDGKKVAVPLGSNSRTVWLQMCFR